LQKVSEEYKNMITINYIEKEYKKDFILEIKNLEFKFNEITGIVGNNGAGKTTLLCLILDLIKATKGSVKSKGEIVAKNDSWKNYTGSYLNEGFLIPYLTPVEYLEFVCKLHYIDIGYVLKFLNNNSMFFDNEMINKYIRELSTGNKNKIGILATLIINPEIIILDEPFANLDPSSQLWLKIKLREIKKGQVTVILSSNDLKHVTEVCDRIVLLDKGKIIKDIETNSETLIELENFFIKERPPVSKPEVF
jgi:ABC-2 type transport system ATP-binding protein